VISAEYAAGFFDGEGCCRIHHIKTTSQVSLRVIVANTNPTPLLLFKQRWGGTLRAIQQRSAWKTRWDWAITANQAERFLLDIQEFAVIKRPVIELGLEFCRFLREPGRLVRAPAADGRRLYFKSERTLARERQFIERCRLLNLTGSEGDQSISRALVEAEDQRKRGRRLF
jgi:hypothetical protein